MVQVKSVLLHLFVCLGLVYFANAQSSCAPINIDDLGNTTTFSTDGLIPNALPTAGETTNPVPARIFNYTIVCDASGMNRSTSSFVSVVVQFQCDFPSGSGTLEPCDRTTMVTRQYQFSCIIGDWNAIISGVDTFVQTLSPNTTLTTPLDNQCRRCIDDRQNSNADPITHCEREFKYRTTTN